MKDSPFNDKELTPSLSSVNQKLEKILKYQEIILLYTKISDLHIRYKKDKYENKSYLIELFLSMVEKIEFYHKSDPTYSLWSHCCKELDEIIFPLIKSSPYRDILNYCLEILTLIINCISSSNSI